MAINQDFNILDFNDTIHGNEGHAEMTTYHGGKRSSRTLFECKEVETNAELLSVDGKTMGKRAQQSKPDGISYSGKLTGYRGTNDFVQMLVEYKETGRLRVFDLFIENRDNNSSITDTERGGKPYQVGIYGCKLKGNIPIIALLSGDAAMEFELEFTFQNFEILSYYGQPAAFIL